MTLPDDSTEKWKYKEHTKVKHEIISKYIIPWINIVGKYNNELYIFDCFAGKGKYNSGEIGSPLIFIKRLRNFKKKRDKPKKAYLFFIEKNPNNFKNLEAELKKIDDQVLDWITIKIYNNDFSEIFNDTIVKKIEEYSPAFYFIDPFGFKDIPMDIIKKIISVEKTEVFITFMARDINRFIESEFHQRSIKALFGIENINERLKQEPCVSLPRKQAILRLYRDQLHDHADVKYTFSFKVNADDKMQTTYHLIHCTNHPKGCLLMKEIMYNTGTPGRFGYFGPAEGQLTLNHYVRIESLKKFLLEKYKDETKSFFNIIEETLMDTLYIERHYRQAIRELHNKGELTLKKEGPRHGINNDTLIIFKRTQIRITDYFN